MGKILKVSWSVQVIKWMQDYLEDADIAKTLTDHKWNKWKGAYLEGADIGLLLVGLEEHAVGDHGEEQQRHAAAHSLYTCEAVCFFIIVRPW